MNINDNISGNALFVMRRDSTLLKGIRFLKERRNGIELKNKKLITSLLQKNYKKIRDKKSSLFFN